MQLKGREVYNKKLDKIEVVFYNGKKRATDAETKQYIRENFDKINRDALTSEYNAYYGRVLGGKNRSKNAVRIEGQMVSKRFEEEEGLKEVAKKRGFKSVKELFKKDKEYYDAVKNIYSNTGLPYAFFSENIFSEINKHNGKIFINGKEYDKGTAIEKVDKIDKKIFKEYNVYPIKYNVTYKKGSQLHISLPTENFINTHDLEEFMDEQDDIELIGSPGKELNNLEKKKEIFANSKRKLNWWILNVYNKKSGRLKDTFIGTKFQCQQYKNRYNAKLFTFELKKYNGE